MSGLDDHRRADQETNLHPWCELPGSTRNALPGLAAVVTRLAVSGARSLSVDPEQVDHQGRKAQDCTAEGGPR